MSVYLRAARRIAGNSDTPIIGLVKAGASYYQRRKFGRLFAVDTLEDLIYDLMPVETFFVSPYPRDRTRLIDDQQPRVLALLFMHWMSAK